MVTQPGLTSARVALLQQSQGSALLFNGIAAAILACVLSFHHPAGDVMAWLGAVLATSAIRALWLRHERHGAIAEARARNWENVYAAACLLAGAAWGAMFLLFPPTDGFVIALMNLIAAAFGFTAIATFSASVRCYLALIVPIAAAQTWWLYRYSGSELFAAILLAGFYFAVLTVGMVVFRRALRGAVRNDEASRTLLAEQQALFNNSLVGLAMTRERTFIRVNDEFSRLYGIERGALEGHTTRVIYSDDQSWLAAVERAEAGLAAGQVVYEREYTRPDGKQSWLLAQGRLIDAAQPGYGSIWVVADITDRKKAATQLAAREQAYRNLAETYQTLLETTPAMIWTTDKKGRYTFASERGTRALFGVAASELTGKVYSDFVQPDDLPREHAVFKRMLAGETVLDYASQGTRHDGKRISISVSGAPLHDADGNIIGASGTNVDITDRQERVRELGQTRDLLRNAIESIPDGFALFDADDRLVLANQRYIQLYTNAQSFSEISGLMFEDLVRSSLQKGEPVPADFRGDTEAWVAERVRRHRDANGQPYTYRIGAGRIIQVTEKRTPDGGIVGVRTDITDLENARTLLASAIDSMSDGFALFGPDDRIVLCNRRYASMLEGFEPEVAPVGLHLEDIIRRQVAAGQPIPPEFSGSVEEWIAARLERHRRADGVPHIQQLTGGRWTRSIRHRTPDGGIVVVSSDITAIKKSEQAAQLLAQHDALTGLPNRRLLHDRLVQALARSRRASEMVAVLLIDLDDFKPVNDAHGHRAGDEVLRVVANRLKECVREADTVARYGGDEFVVVIDGLAQSADAGAVAAKVVDALSRPIEPLWRSASNPGPAAVQIGCSIGISLFPGDAVNPDVLIRLADHAMYQAKQAGRKRFVYHAAAA